MSTKYQKEFAMPQDFPSTLREFTKEVLRDQPADIHKYGYEYFSAKLREQEKTEPAVIANQEEQQ